MGRLSASSTNIVAIEGRQDPDAGTGGAFLSQAHPKSRPSTSFGRSATLISATRASKSLACKGRRAIHRLTMGMDLT